MQRSTPVDAADEVVHLGSLRGDLRHRRGRGRFHVKLHLRIPLQADAVYECSYLSSTNRSWNPSRWHDWRPIFAEPLIGFLLYVVTDNLTSFSTPEA